MILVILEAAPVVGCSGDLVARLSNGPYGACYGLSGVLVLGTYKVN